MRAHSLRGGALDLISACSSAVQVRSWLAEDVPSFDVGGAVVGRKPETAHLLAKATGVLAGVPFFNAVFAELGCRCCFWKRDAAVCS